MGLATLFGQGGIADFIKSIQKVNINLNTSTNNTTATINAVDTDNSIIIWNGHITTGSQSRYVYAGVALTNSTTLTATRYSGSLSYATVISVTVVEFYPDIVKGKQSGTTIITANGVSATTTITGVNTSKTILATCGQYNSGDTADSPQYNLCRIYLSNSTSVKVIRGGTSSSYAVYVPWNLIEFN